jgi:hypothetical protein
VNFTRRFAVFSVALLSTFVSHGADPETFAPLTAQSRRVEALRALVEAAEERDTVRACPVAPPPSVD